MASGICKLTGRAGKFVKSHLIPEALTRPDGKGLPLAQLRSGTPPVRRWTSWYDDCLVVREGEDVLARLDSWAIEALRQHKLVWSGWEIEGSPVAGSSSWGLREVRGIDFGQLRLFFLSLLWRAAATRRPEFSEITLPPIELHKLGKMLMDGNPQPLHFYPMTLVQISTIGPRQNFTPLSSEKVVPDLDGTGERTYQFFRFYLDGLIAHVHRQASGDISHLGPLVVGAADYLLLPTIPYEESAQKWNLAHILRETRDR